MKKYSKSERIALLMNMFSNSPGRHYTLIYFANLFNCSKSTISEDLATVGALFRETGQGYIESTPGASGGVMFVPKFEEEKKMAILNELCVELSKPERLIYGGYLYDADIINDPSIVNNLGKILASKFFYYSIDYVITVETKGIPLAYATAQNMNVPLVVARHNIDVSDGAFVSINYLSGSSSKIQSMALPIKALKRNSRILFIDDYMKAGGTAKGIVDLAKEFDCTVAGIGVFIETAEPRTKLVDNYYSLLTIDYAGPKKDKAFIRPSANV